MENNYKLGDIKRRDQVGLKGRQKVRFSKCTSCGLEKWAMMPVIENYMCVSCNAKTRLISANKKLNDYPHKIDCKCHRCRIGKGYFKGKNNPSWKGGKKILKTGYVYIFIEPEHKFYSMVAKGVGNGYVAEHRLVMAENIGRSLLKEETVHHKNGIKNDNRIENLELWSSNHHSGQRLEDQIIWAIELLEKNNYLITKK
jgi:hypothetical protein